MLLSNPYASRAYDLPNANVEQKVAAAARKVSLLIYRLDQTFHRNGNDD